MTLSPLAIPALAGTGLCAVWLDAKFRRLPNALSAAVAGLGLAATAGHSGLASAGNGALHALIALVIGLTLYSRGMIGGGDVKYYAGVAAWFPLASGFRLLGFVALAGLGLVACWYLWKRLQSAPTTLDPEADHSKLPFGIAIAAGALLTAIAP